MPSPRTIVALVCLIAAGPGTGAGLSTSGTWSPQITTSTYRAAPIDSAASALLINIDVAETEAWTVSVQTQNANLPEGLTLSIKRITNGTGDGAISGGTDYATVGDTAQIMFSGTGNRQGVGVQLRLNGIAGGRPPPGNYGASILYSLESH